MNCKVYYCFILVSLTHQLAMEKIAQEDVEPGFIISKNNIGKIAFKKKRLLVGT